MTELEKAIKVAASALRDEPFGEELSKANPHLRSREAKSVDAIANYEMGHGPPIGRTLSVALLLAHTGKADAIPADDRQYLLWIVAAHEYLCSLTPTFWTGLRPDVYSAFFDWDDVPAYATHHLPQLHRKKAPNPRTTAAGVRASPITAAAWSSVARAAQCTQVWRAARAAGMAIAGDRRRYARMVSRRQELIESMRPAPNETVAAAREIMRARATAELAGSTLEERALRRYNHLVQASVAGVLGICESFYEFPPITEIDGPLEAEDAEDGVQIHFTSLVGLPFLATSTPFEVELDGPFDGLYLCERHSFRFGSSESSDVWGGGVPRSLEK